MATDEPPHRPDLVPHVDTDGTPLIHLEILAALCGVYPDIRGRDFGFPGLDPYMAACLLQDHRESQRGQPDMVKAPAPPPPRPQRDLPPASWQTIRDEARQRNSRRAMSIAVVALVTSVAAVLLASYALWS